MKNKRKYIIAEAANTVNEIQLDELFSLASKAEQQIIGLVERAVKFSNAQIKNKATALKSMASEFSTLLSDIITTESGITPDEPKERLDAPQNDKEDIETRRTHDEREIRGEAKSTIKKIVENEAKEYKTLIEALTDELEEEDLEDEDDINDENLENDTDEKENCIDISMIISDLIASADNDALINAKEAILSYIQGDETLSGNETLTNAFEAVIDADSFNAALDDLYDYADENGLTVKI